MHSLVFYLFFFFIFFSSNEFIYRPLFNYTNDYDFVNKVCTHSSSNPINFTRLEYNRMLFKIWNKVINIHIGSKSV